MRAHYWRTKPLHASQTELPGENGYVIFEWQVIPNFELKALLLSFGPNLEVLTPEHLRLDMQLALREALGNY